MSGPKVSRGVFWVGVLSVLLFSADSTAQKAKKGRPPHKPQGVEGGGASKNGKNPAKQMWRKEKALASASKWAPSARPAHGPATSVRPYRSPPARSGRSSVAINDANSLVFTKTFPGTACDPDARQCAHFLDRLDRLRNGQDRAARAGRRSGESFFRQRREARAAPCSPHSRRPSAPPSMTTPSSGRPSLFRRSARRDCRRPLTPLGAFVAPNVRLGTILQATGFLYEATTAGTTGGRRPPGRRPSGEPPRTARSCGPRARRRRRPFRVATRCSSSCAPRGERRRRSRRKDRRFRAGCSLSGWGEFYDLNNAGVAAFKGAIAGLATVADANGNADESSTGLFTSPPLTLAPGRATSSPHGRSAASARSWPSTKRGRWASPAFLRTRRTTARTRTTTASIDSPPAPASSS